MSNIDFAIGAFLMNAMPHLILGIWKGRMLSGFGIGDKQNIAYGTFCCAVSIGLYIYKYGIEHYFDNGIYAGASSILIFYFLTGYFWHAFFGKRQ